MSEPLTHTDPLHGIASEIISAMSALNMPPDPMETPKGEYLSERDNMVRHAMEHLKAAMECQLSAYQKMQKLEAKLWQLERRIP